MQIRSARVGHIVGLALAGLALAACGGAVAAGSAAVLGEDRVTTTQVADQVAQMRAEFGW